MCDRCGAVNVQVVPIVGLDLCNRCVADFKLWASEPPGDVTSAPRARKRRTPFGEPLRVAKLLLADSGELTVDAYGEATAKPAREAYQTLNYLVRCGALERVRRPAGVRVYRLPSTEAAE